MDEFISCNLYLGHGKFYLTKFFEILLSISKINFNLIKKLHFRFSI